MKAGAHIMVAAAARFYAPLIMLFALSLLAGWQSSTGVGFVAGAVAGLALALHALVYGAVAARAAFPSWACRAALALGLIAVLIGVGAPELMFAARIVEAGLFVLMVGAAAWIIAVLFGRAPTLRDAEW